MSPKPVTYRNAGQWMAPLETKRHIWNRYCGHSVPSFFLQISNHNTQRPLPSCGTVAAFRAYLCGAAGRPRHRSIPRSRRRRRGLGQDRGHFRFWLVLTGASHFNADANYQRPMMMSLAATKIFRRWAARSFFRESRSPKSILPSSTSMRSPPSMQIKRGRFPSI